MAGVCNNDNKISDTIYLLSSIIRCDILKFGIIRFAKKFIIVVSRIRILYTESLNSIKYYIIFKILLHN